MFFNVFYSHSDVFFTTMISTNWSVRFSNKTQATIVDMQLNEYHDIVNLK